MPYLSNQMTIQFCPTCKNMLMIITKNNSQYIICKKCETQEPQTEENSTIITEKITNQQIGKGTAEKDFSGHDFKCKLCQNTKCKLIDLGMMFGDEDWIYLLQCTKCNYSKRVGSWC